MAAKTHNARVAGVVILSSGFSGEVCLIRLRRINLPRCEGLEEKGTARNKPSPLPVFAPTMKTVGIHDRWRQIKRLVSQRQAVREIFSSVPSPMPV